MRWKFRIAGVNASMGSGFPVILTAKSGSTCARLKPATRARGAPAWRPNITGYQCLVVVGVFLLTVGVAEAQVDVERDKGILATLLRWAPLILKGFMTNLQISFVAMAIGTFLGIFLGLAQISLFKPARAGAYVTTQFFRNSPWLVLLFFMTLSLPFQVTIGDTTYIIPDWLKATIGFSLPIMANISEVVRGAVVSMPFGQWEAAESLAFTRSQTLWRVILPQCIKRMIPAWMNWYAILALATPVCSIMGVEEAVNYTMQAINAEDGRPELLAPFYFFVLALFFVYIYPISRVTIWLEKKYAVIT